MKKIKLTKGRHALVDNKDFEQWGHIGWYAHSNGYVRGEKVINGKRSIFYLHSKITGTPKGKHTDHINGNKLDNRRRNLRVCNASENGLNRNGRNKNNTSGYPCVSKHVSGGWCAYAYDGGKSRLLGYFKTKREAINRRKEYESSRD